MKRLWLAGLVSGMLAILLLSGCNAVPSGGSPSSPPAVDAAPTQPKPVGQTHVPVVENIPIKVYFASHDARYVVAETHMVKKDALVLRHAMEVLVAGPKNSSLLPVVPPGTKVKSVQVTDRTGFVDFSSEMIKKGFGGSSMEILTVGSIVNTLTEFPEVERVQILVEGKKVSTLFGHLDVSDPLSRSPGIIKNK